MSDSDNNRPSLNAVIESLGLEPLPVEGGYFRSTYLTQNSSAIYYLITPDSWSAFHRLSSDEVWHFYAGDPARQLQIFPDRSHKIFRIGRNFSEGEVPQLLSPAGVWQSTRLEAEGKWALFGTTMAPPYSNEQYDHGEQNTLSSMYPELSDIIREFLE